MCVYIDYFILAYALNSTRTKRTQISYTKMSSYICVALDAFVCKVKVLLMTVPSINIYPKQKINNK